MEKQQSGKKRVGQTFQVCDTVLAMMRANSENMRGIVIIQIDIHIQWERRKQINMGYMTYMVMSGNGVLIGMTKNIFKSPLLTTRRGHRQESSVSCAAGRGGVFRGNCAQAAVPGTGAL